jgi:hypothetical protein
MASTMRPEQLGRCDRPHVMARRPWFCLALVGLAACGSNDGMTQPTKPTGLSGTWSYSANATSGDTIACAVTDATLMLTQIDTTFSGTYKNAQVSCTVNSAAHSATQAGKAINGILSGQNVSFDFDSADVSNLGALTPDSTGMSGTVAVRLFGASMTGTWSAKKS